MTATAAAAVLPALLVVVALLVWPRRAGGRISASWLRDSARGAATDRPPLWGRVLRRRGAGPDDGFDAQLLAVAEALAGALRAGLPPAEALALARSGVTGVLGEALAGVERRARLGDGLAVGWHEAAQRLDNDELRILARAWSLSEETGTALADAAHTTAAVLRDEREQRDRTKAAVAGARTTMTILTILPLGGPLLAAFMGLDMRTVYAGSPLVWAALGGGLVLVVLGRWWIDRLVAHTLAGPLLR